MMDGLDTEEIYFSNLENSFTIGAEYYGKNYVHTANVVKRINHSTLHEISKRITDGDHGSADYQDDGVLYLLSESVQEGYIDVSKCRFIATQKNEELKRSELHPGDIVVTKTGVYFGKSAVIPNNIKMANMIAHVGKIELKDGYNPYYVSTFLNSKFGYYQLRRRGIKATRPEIKLVEFPEIMVPFFSETFEQKIESMILLANQILSCSSASMSQCESILTKKMGFDVKAIANTNYSVRLFGASYCNSGRLDAEYYQPKYDEYYSIITRFKGGHSCIRKEFSQVKERCDRTLENYRYVEIGDINISSGFATSNTIATDALPDNAKIMTQKDDIIISTVRPNRGAVAILEEDNLLVSGAFTVLRERGEYKKEVLQVLLRLPLYRDWLLRYNVGTSYPVIRDDDVLNIPIPLFDNETQSIIVAKVKESSDLRKQSKQLLEYAKQAVEMAIEQGEDMALEWLKDKVN